MSERAEVHAALGDQRRLVIVDHLALGDRTVGELADVSGMGGNLLAHHLDLLESAGLIERRVSEGDHRRRYVVLKWDRLPSGLAAPPSFDEVLFVCTRNSARSQFAAALWERMTGRHASSAGHSPAPRVNPKAVQVAHEYDIDLSSALPRGYEDLDGEPDLVISVCDRALEAGVPTAQGHAHWSVPDPVTKGTIDAFRSAFDEIAVRMEHLVGATHA